MLRSLILSVALFALTLPRLATSGEAVALDAPQSAAIQSVIGAQLEAFQRDDGTAAFSYASPGIREKFGSVAHFMAMVRSGYPAVYRPREVTYLEARVKDGVTVQAVRLLGPGGAEVIALYFMEQQPDGSWRIAGVTLVDSGEVGS